MGGNGGTQMYCPGCKRITVCKAIPLGDVGEHGGQRWYRVGHDDIQWFRRARKCQTCNHRFVTSEVQETFLDELVDLRQALGDLKKNAEKYAKASKEAETTLHELTKSLQVLRALKIYKDS